MKSHVSHIIIAIKVAKEEQPQHGRIMTQASCKCCLHTKYSSSMFCGPGEGTGGTGCPVVRFGCCIQNRQMKKLDQVPLKMSYHGQAEGKVKDLEVQVKDLKDQFRNLGEKE